MYNYDNLDVMRGDVWWCDFNGYEGHEQAHRRPCVVVSNNSCNKFSPTITVVPLTTAPKKNLPTHTTVLCDGIKGTALAEHISTIDKSRLVEYKCAVEDYDLERIEKCIRVQVGICEDESEVEAISAIGVIEAIESILNKQIRVCNDMRGNSANKEREMYYDGGEWSLRQMKWFLEDIKKSVEREKNDSD